jgi:heat-inducible transcriptional repressor
LEVMLDERKATILRAVVEEYIETAEPVGSGRVAGAPAVTVSSATVRNEMVALEAEGYLQQPHTSAGRVPTEKGYRYYVDTIEAIGDLATADSSRVRDFFDHAHGELERMLGDTSRLLAGLTDCAAVVLSPPYDAATVRSVQLVSLAPRVVLLVVVLANGVVDKHTLELSGDVDEADVDEAGQQLAGLVVDQPTDSRPVPSGRQSQLVERALDAIYGGSSIDHDADHVFVEGASRVASAFDAVDTVREILSILEEQLVVVSLIRDVMDRGLSVAIGTETGMQPLSECSLVVSPYEVGGRAAGTIGVLGPTRMDYPQALAAVAVVSQSLGRRLTEG